MPLTFAFCKAVQPLPKLKKYSDGQCLQLWVFPNGTKAWRYTYHWGDKQQLLALGLFPEVSITEARDARDRASRQKREGQNPATVRRIEKLVRKSDALTFAAVADEFIAKARREGQAPATLKKLEWILRMAKLDLGSQNLGSITGPTVLAVLRKVEARGKYSTAIYMRKVIGAVFRYGCAEGKALTDPTVNLRGALTSVPEVPRPAITDPKKLGQLLRSIDCYAGLVPQTRMALQLLALCFVRPGELSRSKWSEFDLEKGIWCIPLGRMKTRREHQVPLSRQAMEILNTLKLLTGSTDFLFPSIRSVARPMSDNTLNAAFGRLGYSRAAVCPYGFRTSASSLLTEVGRFKEDVIEVQMDHKVRGGIRRVYMRAQFIQERAEMMQWWGDYLDRLRIHDCSSDYQVA